MTAQLHNAFNQVANSSLFRRNGPKIDLCDALIAICDAIHNDDDENKWSLGEFGDCSLDSLLIGAYWALTEWHSGQSSPEYAALCAIGTIFSPGMTRQPESDDEPEYWPYVAINNHFAKLNNAPDQIINA